MIETNVVHFFWGHPVLASDEQLSTGVYGSSEANTVNFFSVHKSPSFLFISYNKHRRLAVRRCPVCPPLSGLSGLSAGVSGLGWNAYTKPCHRAIYINTAFCQPRPAVCAAVLPWWSSAAPQCCRGGRLLRGTPSAAMLLPALLLCWARPLQHLASCGILTADTAGEMLQLAGLDITPPQPAAFAGTASAGTASSGTASAGTASAGTGSTGTASAGTAFAGTASSGTASAGTASLGTVSAGTGSAGTAFAGTAEAVPAEAYVRTASIGTADAGPPTA